MNATMGMFGALDLSDSDDESDGSNGEAAEKEGGEEEGGEEGGEERPEEEGEEEENDEGEEGDDEGAAAVTAAAALQEDGQGTDKDSRVESSTTDSRPRPKVIVFEMFKKSARDLSVRLRDEFDYDDCVCLHGDMSQTARRKAIDRFREPVSSSSMQVMVATDVAARGVDIQGVTHVILYSVGISVEHYVHRVGRCGRGGQLGTAHTFFLADLDSKHAPALVGLLDSSHQPVEEELREIAWRERQRLEKHQKAEGRRGGGGLGEEDTEEIIAQRRENALRQRALATAQKQKNTSQGKGQPSQRRR
jgi:superfamily II DNA/RNA helicase